MGSTSDTDLFRLRNTTTIRVSVVFQPDCLFTVVLAEEVRILTLVASGDELLEAKLLKVIGEVVEEVAHSRVVTITVNDPVAEVFLVVSELLLNVGESGVKLVLLTGLCVRKKFRLGRHAPIMSDGTYKNVVTRW